MRTFGHDDMPLPALTDAGEPTLNVMFYASFIESAPAASTSWHGDVLVTGSAR